MATTNALDTGTAGGLLAFCDHLEDRDHASCGVIHPWRYAITRVFTLMEGDDFASVDVLSLDVDEYMRRFAGVSRGADEPEKLAKYAPRLPQAIEAYRGYLADPTGWRPA